MPLTYRDVYEQRVASGEAKPKGDNNSITVEGAIDKSNDKLPKVPTLPSTTLPVDDPYKKMRTEQA